MKYYKHLFIQLLGLILTFIVIPFYQLYRNFWLESTYFKGVVDNYKDAISLFKEMYMGRFDADTINQNRQKIKTR